MVFRFFFLRFSGRRAVSTIIGGLIILTLILTALVTMVFVSQQYDQYQQAVNQMAQNQNQGQSENIVANSPGLTSISATTGWGSGCTTKYNCYNMTVSNLGGVGVQIVRIYINSTGSGCSSPNHEPCILNPSSTITYYSFNQANQFINTGEVNHAVLLALPNTITLPSAYYSTNTIFIVTSRGNVFSFKWPFPVQIFGGQSQSAFSTGILKIAYQDISTTGTGVCSTPTSNGYPTGIGCDSSHDYYNAPSHTSPPYCHNEPEKMFVAPTNYGRTHRN